MLRISAAFVAGLATALSFGPFGYFPFGVLGPVVLFYLWLEATPRSCFWRGAAFGLGLFGLGISWTFVSLHVYGHMPVPLAALSVFLFTLLLAMFPAVTGLLQSYCRCSRIVRVVVVIPALWTLTEWIRGWVLTGFPWMSLGYGQIDSVLAGFAPWVGVYGVSLMTAICAGLVVAMLLNGDFLRRAGAATALIAILSLGWFVNRVDLVEPSSEPLTVTMIQGNIPLETKWHPADKDDIIKLYLDLSQAHANSDLIVWPEAALPEYLDRLPGTFWSRIETHPADFVLGILERVKDEGVTHSYNSVLAYTGEPSLYRKQHLVPFGEYVPLSFLFDWIMAYLNIPMSDFSAWSGVQAPITIAGTRAAVTICYEDAFVEEVRESLGDANLLINVSEDSWFGDSFAPHQRLDMGRMRALESGRPMVRAGNSGISAAIDHKGRVTARTPQFIRTVLVTQVQPMQGTTPFVLLGTLPLIVLCFVILLLCFVAGARNGQSDQRTAQADQ